MKNQFTDKAEITIKSGKGGNGAVSFRREPFVPQGGPDGGNGGNGGSVIFKADPALHTLMDFRYKRKYEAEAGEDGKKKKQYGKNGADLVITVPAGTVLKDAETGEVLADLSSAGQSFTAAIGGRGGRGNFLFRNSVRQAPNFAEAGGFATEKRIELELKLIADVGLIGFPNAGKSTLLAASTKASPKIASYRFTTLSPNLGVVQMFDKGFVMADIPGLIEGASEGLGLGFEFLRHIERTRVLIHVIDASGSEGRAPLDDYEKINKELESYGKSLMKKPRIIAANKMDIIADDKSIEDLKAAVKRDGHEFYLVSAATGVGIKELLSSAYKKLSEDIPEEKPEIINKKVLRPEEEADYTKVNCEFENGIYKAYGKQLEKIFNSTNFNDEGSTRYLYKYLEKSGAIKRLKEMGLKDGDTVLLSGHEYEYKDE